MSEWECVIVDDGSSDDTRNVAEQYCQHDGRFSYLHQENQGPAAARNNGIAHTSGSYILPVDADDKISPAYLEKAAAYLEQYPETTLVYGLVELFGDKSGLWSLPDYNYNDIIWNNSIMCSAMYRREDYNKTSGYNINMRNGFEDWDFWLSLLNPNSVVHRIEEVMYYYRITQRSHSADASEHSKELLQTIYLNHQDIYAPFVTDIITLHRMQQSRAYSLGQSILKPYHALKRWFNRCIIHK